MPELSNTIENLPDAPWYVITTDTFLSGWGHAEGRTNRHVIPCPTLEIAELIRTEFDRRPEMRRPVILRNRPRQRPGQLLTHGPTAPTLARAIEETGRRPARPAGPAPAYFYADGEDYDAAPEPYRPSELFRSTPAPT